MNMITNHLPTAELQRLDAAHHFHPFTDKAALAAKGARVITRAEERARLKLEKRAPVAK